MAPSYMRITTPRNALMVGIRLNRCAPTAKRRAPQPHGCPAEKRGRLPDFGKSSMPLSRPAAITNCIGYCASRHVQRICSRFSPVGCSACPAAAADDFLPWPGLTGLTRPPTPLPRRPQRLPGLGCPDQVRARGTWAHCRRPSTSTKEARARAVHAGPGVRVVVRSASRSCRRRSKSLVSIARTKVSTTAAIVAASPGVIMPSAGAEVTAFIAAAMSAALSIGGKTNFTTRSRHGGRMRSMQSRNAVGSPTSAASTACGSRPPTRPRTMPQRR